MPASQFRIRLTSELKTTIEDAAAVMGQTVSDFVISTLMRTAHETLPEQQITRVSKRDRQLLVKMLDHEATRPNEALVKAAGRYKKRVERTG